MLTKYCTCAEPLSWLQTGFSIMVELEPYMLKPYLINKYDAASRQKMWGFGAAGGTPK